MAPLDCLFKQGVINDLVDYAFSPPLRFRSVFNQRLIQPSICLTIIGGGLSVFVDWTGQVRANLDQGKDFWQASYHENLDEKQLTVSGVEGATSTFVFVTLGPTSLSQAVVYGGLANVVGGQAGAITDATWEQGVAVGNGNNYDGWQYFVNAQDAGLLNPSSILVDWTSGAITAGVGSKVSSYIPVFGPVKSPGGPAMIQMAGRNFGVEISGRPGLFLPSSQQETILYAAGNALTSNAQGVAETILSNAISDVLGGSISPNTNKKSKSGGGGSRMTFY